jgi:hypothetical protein
VVLDTDSGEALRYYESVREAAVRLGVLQSSIVEVCQKRNKSSRGLGWRFAHPEDEEQGEVENAVPEEELKRRILEYVPVTGPVLADKAVVVLDKDSGEALRYYESVTEAAVRLGVLQSSILGVCQKRFKSFKGFRWRFAHPEEQGQGANAVSEEELKRRILEWLPGKGRPAGHVAR